MLLPPESKARFFRRQARMEVTILTELTLSLFTPVAYRGGVWGVQPPPPEIPKISVESSIAQTRRTGVSISFYSSLCSHTVVIY